VGAGGERRPKHRVTLEINSIFIVTFANLFTMGTKKDLFSIMCDKTMTSILNNTNGVMHMSYKIQYESASIEIEWLS